MNHEQVTGLDLAIVGIYLVVMVVVGVITSKKLRTVMTTIWQDDPLGRLC